MPASIHSIALDFPPLKKALGVHGEGPAGLIPTFVIGPENAMIMELLSPAGVMDLGARSPIFLYGTTGTGKTTLGLTLAGRWSMLLNTPSITATTGTDFARQYAHAAAADDMERFRQRHRQASLLFIDGVHELVGREAAQEELIYTLDELLENGRPVIVTGPKLALSIRGLRSALASRLMGGASFAIHPPGKESRCMILEELNRSIGANLTSAQLAALADQLPLNSTALQLRGVLVQWAHQQRLAPSAGLGALQQVIDFQHLSRVPAVQDIAKAVCRQMGVKMSDLRGDTRKANIVRARGLAMLLVRQATGMSLQQIGAFFGDRDHTTVLHALRKTESELGNDADLQRAAEELRQLFA